MRSTAAGIFLLLHFAGCAVPRISPEWRMPIVKTVETKGLPTSRVFDLSRLWLVRYLYSEKSIIDYENRAEGDIIANGTVDYPATGLEAVARVQYTISFRLRELITDAGVALSFDSLLINVPKNYDFRSRLWQVREYYGGYARPLVSDEEYEAALLAVTGVAEGLRRFLEEERKKHP
jgi:hypothetical protein